MDLEKEVITLRKQLKEAEITIARSRNRDSLVRQASRIGYWDFTPSTGHLQWSPEVLPLVAGLPSGEIETTYENFNKFVHKDDADELNQTVFKAAEDGSSFDSFYRVIHDDGSTHWLRGWGGVVKSEGSDRMIGAVMDVTDQKEEEMKLKTAYSELRKKTKDLETFNKVMIDRELRIIEMKEEVNKLSLQLGLEPQYPEEWKK